MTLDSLRNLYVRELQDLYSAETQLVKGLPRLVRGATSPELKTAFKEHLAQTKGHVQRLDTVFAGLGESPAGAKCKAMAALLKEGRDLLKLGGSPAVVDAALITAAQKVEHYEMAGYGSARTYANMLRFDEAAGLLQETLNEEGRADQILTELSEALISMAETQPDRVDDVAMYGDTRSGGTDLAGMEDAGMGAAVPEVDDTADDLGDDEPDEETGGMPSEPLDAGGTSGHWEVRRQPTGDPATGD